MVEEYLVAASAAAVVVVLLELCVLRTGLFRRPAYWITMVIVLGFQVLVDGEVAVEAGALAVLGVLPSGDTVIKAVRERLDRT